MFLNVIYIKACVQNKAQHCASSACFYYTFRWGTDLKHKQTTVKKKREFIQRKYLPSWSNRVDDEGEKEEFLG